MATVTVEHDPDVSGKPLQVETATEISLVYSIENADGHGDRILPGLARIQTV